MSHKGNNGAERRAFAIIVGTIGTAVGFGFLTWGVDGESLGLTLFGMGLAVTLLIVAAVMWSKANTPAVLASDPNPKVRLKPASNQATEDSLLRILARDENLEVRNAAIAQYWTRHSSRADEAARIRMAKDPRTRAEDVAILAEDVNDKVQAAVCRTIPDYGSQTTRLLAGASHDEIRLSVATCDRVPPDALQSLARDRSAGIRAAVAKNPSTPTEALHGLANDTEESVRLALAGNANTPRAALASLARDRSGAVRSAVAGFHKTPGEILALLAQDVDANVRKALCGALSIRTIDDKHLRTIAQSSDVAVRRACAAAWSVPTDLLDDLSRDVDVSVRATVARNHNSGADALARLADDQDVSVRAAVADLWDRATRWSDRDVPGLQFDAAKLSRLALVRNAQVRRGVAQSPRLPSQQVARLAMDPIEEVRRAAADAIETRGDLVTRDLTKLAHSADDKVRLAVAAHLWNHPNRDLLLHLAADANPNVRARIVHNSAVPPEALAELADDAEPRVRKAVLEKLLSPRTTLTPQAFEALAHVDNTSIRECVAKMPDTPAEVLVRLADDPMEAVRKAAAEGMLSSNPYVRDREFSSAALAELAQVRNVDVRAVVARHHATDAETLEALSNDTHDSVREAVATNIGPSAVILAEDPDIPMEILVRFARSESSDVRHGVAKNPKSSSALLANLARDVRNDVRQSVAIHPHTTADTLAYLASDSEPVVRQTVARNSTTAPAVLRNLASDPVGDVRQAVAANPHTPTDTLMLLGSDPDTSVGISLTQNPNIQADILAALIRKHNSPKLSPFAHMFASWRPRGIDKSVLETADQYYSDLWWVQGVRQAVATHPRTPIETLELLANAPDTVGQIACNPRTPPATLRRLAYHEAVDVRRAVAENVKTPPDTLSSLSLDENPSVRSAAINNPNTRQ